MAPCGNPYIKMFRILNLRRHPAPAKKMVAQLPPQVSSTEGTQNCPWSQNGLKCQF